MNETRKLNSVDNAFVTFRYKYPRIVMMRRRAITLIDFNKDDFREFKLIADGQCYVFPVQENQELIENLIADFQP